jgi:hypothetical protein
MFSSLRRLTVHDSDFEQLLTYEIAIPTDQQIRERIEECNKDLEKRGLNAFSPRGILEKDSAGSMLISLHRVNRLRAILRSHGWEQSSASD